MAWRDFWSLLVDFRGLVVRETVEGAAETVQLVDVEELGVCSRRAGLGLFEELGGDGFGGDL